MIYPKANLLVLVFCLQVKVVRHAVYQCMRGGAAIRILDRRRSSNDSSSEVSFTSFIENFPSTPGKSANFSVILRRCFFQWVRCNAARQDRAYQIAFSHVAALTSGQPTACSETVNRLAPHTWVGCGRLCVEMEMARVPGYGIVGSQSSCSPH